MQSTIRLEVVDDLRENADKRVCHYDELSESVKEEFPHLTGDDEAAVDQSLVDGFGECELIKYTDYYEISTE